MAPAKSCRDQMNEERFMRKELVPVSKFLSLVLRHKPDSIGLDLDEHGWADIDSLIERASRQGRTLTRAVIDEVVATNEKKRFAISDDGARIRASQGHSIAVDLELKAVMPPDMLFHGTATRFLTSIREHGLRPGNRQHVHLSKDEKTARIVGARHGEPIILGVRAAAMHRDGHRFFLSDNGVWLTGPVPLAFIAFPKAG